MVFAHNHAIYKHKKPFPGRWFRVQEVWLMKGNE